MNRDTCATTTTTTKKMKKCKKNNNRLTSNRMMSAMLVLLVLLSSTISSSSSPWPRMIMGVTAFSTHRITSRRRGSATTTLAAVKGSSGGDDGNDSNNNKEVTLITFDVDGTLVTGSGQAADTSAHARAFSHAVQQILAANGSDHQPNIIPPVADVLPRHKFHGSTDGLILLRLAHATLGISPEEIMMTKEEDGDNSNNRNLLDEMMLCMYDYINELSDEEISHGLSLLPGVLDTLHLLSDKTPSSTHQNTICGLVTGNVEGIARRKMNALGILQTNALHKPKHISSKSRQQERWIGSEQYQFLGGFGSDYCSGNIIDEKYNYLDRSKQFEIAIQRCNNELRAIEQEDDSSPTTTTTPMSKYYRRLHRAVHVGDAPADVLAAKTYAMKQLKEQQEKNDDSMPPLICVGMVGVATGSYTVEQLTEVAGEPIPGLWEPIILAEGMKDPNQFLNACYYGSLV